MCARRFRILSLAGLFVAALALSMAQSANAQHLPQYYQIAEVRVPGATQTQAVGINDQQQAVLTWNHSSGKRAALYDGNTGQFTVLDLGTLPGGTMTDPRAINNAGEVVGFAYVPGFVGHAFIYRNGTMHELGMLPGAAQWGAEAINDAGVAVGWSYQTSGETIAVKYSSGSVTRLTTAESHALSVNSFGVAVGYGLSASDGMYHAVLLRNGVMTDIGKPGFSSTAVAINDSENIAGYESAYGSSFEVSFITSPGGGRTDLGALPGLPSTRAYAMNHYGMIVGASRPSKSGPAARAFVYGDCRIEDLTNMIDSASPLKPYVTLLEGTAINANGWILAHGRDSREPFPWRAYILKPVGPPDNICT